MKFTYDKSKNKKNIVFGVQFGRRIIPPPQIFAFFAFKDSINTALKKYTSILNTGEEGGGIFIFTIS